MALVGSDEDVMNGLLSEVWMEQWKKLGRQEAATLPLQGLSEQQEQIVLRNLIVESRKRRCPARALVMN